MESSGLATDSRLARRLWAVSAQALVSRGLATLNEMIALADIAMCALSRIRARL